MVRRVALASGGLGAGGLGVSCPRSRRWPAGPPARPEAPCPPAGFRAAGRVEPDLADDLLAAAAGAVGSGSLEVVTRRRGRLVARSTVHGQQDVVIKVSVSAGDFAAEAAAVRTLAAAGLPVPRIQAMAEGPPAVLVAQWTPGRGVTQDDDVPVRRQIADLLRRVHALPAGPPYAGGEDHLVSWIDGWCRYAFAWWAGQPGITAGTVRDADSWYAEVRSLIDGRRGSQILLDGAPDHFIVGPDRRVRMIDVANLQPGDPVMDLAVLRLHQPDLLAGVMDSYAHPEVTPDHLDSLQPFYVFLRTLALAEWQLTALDNPVAAQAWCERAHRSLRTRGRSTPGSP